MATSTSHKQNFYVFLNRCPALCIISIQSFFFLSRERATADECLLHSWLAQIDIPDTVHWIKNTEDGANTVVINEEECTSDNSTDGEKSEDSLVTEELIVVASYTLGQCRQSEKEKIVEQKTISKRFKFEEPLLQEIPGEFIY